MRGLSIIWDWLLESQQANDRNCPCCAITDAQVQFWGDLTRVKKLRVVGVGHKHIKESFAASLDDAMAGWSKVDVNYREALRHYESLRRARSSSIPLPFDGLEHVRVTVTVGAQLFDQIAVHWLLYPTMTYEQRRQVISWQNDFMMPLTSTTRLRHQPITRLDVQMPPHPESRGPVGAGENATAFYIDMKVFNDHSQASYT